MLAVAGLADARVPATQPLQYLAKVRAAIASFRSKDAILHPQPLLLCHVEEEAGHFGGHADAHYKAQALEQVFLYRALGLNLV
jgi:protease II